MLSHVHIQIRQRLGPDPQYRWFSQQELAELWRRHPVTIRKWLMAARRAGRGPQPDQWEKKQLNAALRVVLLRGDYALFLREWVRTRGMK